MTHLIGKNGNGRGRKEVIVKNFHVSMQVECVCGRALLIGYIPGMNLATTCTCKRVMALRGMQLDPNTGQLGTAIVVDDRNTLTPSDSEINSLIKGL